MTVATKIQYSVSRAVEEAVLDRAAQRERRDDERDPEPGLDRGGDAQHVRVRGLFGDRSRQQLLDRPVEHRDDDEDRRPQQRDAAVLIVGSEWLASEKYV